MEIPTKEEAVKELVEIIYDSEEYWYNLDDYLTNSVENLSDINPEGHTLFFAAVANDCLEDFLQRYYNLAQEAGWIENFEVCKDCYDMITSEDTSIEDVFIHHYGEEEGIVRATFVGISVTVIEKAGKFWQEIPELLNSFSKNPCHCCKSNLHGERFFMIFKRKEKR